MSDPALPLDEEALAKVQKARDMVHALCQPRGTKGSREWMMSIPVRPDHDPDCVIADGLDVAGDAARAALALRDRCERQERLLAELRPVVAWAIKDYFNDDGPPHEYWTRARDAVSVLPPQAREWALADEPQGGGA